MNVLTRREVEVLQLMLTGKTHKEVGVELSVSIETSKKHMQNIYRKLEINSKGEALYLMLKHLCPHLATEDTFRFELMKRFAIKGGGLLQVA